MSNMIVKMVTRKEAQENAKRGNGIEPKCKVCGGYHNKYLQVNGLKGYAENGKSAYIGTECVMAHEYHDEDGVYVVTDEGTRLVAFIQNKSGTDNTTISRKPHCTVEIEAVSSLYGGGTRMAYMKAMGLVEGVPADVVFQHLVIRIMMIGSKKNGHGQHVSLDCTVTVEGHAWFKSLQGLRKFLDGCTEEELKCFRSIKCGAHIHASTEYTPQKWMFEKLLAKIEAVGSAKRIELFGSDFRGYATDAVGGHGCTINIYTGYNTCEMRLTRINNPSQFLQICKFWRNCIAVMNTQYYAPTVDNKIARQFDRLLSGAFRDGE